MLQTSEHPMTTMQPMIVASSAGNIEPCHCDRQRHATGSCGAARAVVLRHRSPGDGQHGSTERETTERDAEGPSRETGVRRHDQEYERPERDNGAADCAEHVRPCRFRRRLVRHAS